MNNIWLLLATGDENLCVAPIDLRYFHNHFIAKPMSDNWQLPPLEYRGKSKKLRDFVGWMIQAPVVSQKAKDLIQDLCGNDIEFLKFHDLKGKPYYAMNVLRVENVLDLDRCQIIRDEEMEDVISIETYAFKENLPDNLPPIFKESNDLGEIFVTKKFADMAIENKLTGLALGDPSVNQFGVIIRGENPNVVSGIIT